MEFFPSNPSNYSCIVKEQKIAKLLRFHKFFQSNVFAIFLVKSKLSAKYYKTGVVFLRFFNQIIFNNFSPQIKINTYCNVFLISQFSHIFRNFSCQIKIVYREKLQNRCIVMIFFFPAHISRGISVQASINLHDHSQWPIQDPYQAVFVYLRLPSRHLESRMERWHNPHRSAILYA